MIESIRLQNVLAFQDLTLEARGLTVLSGTNSAGKSSILHTLALLRQSEDAQTLPHALLLNGNLVELGIGDDILHSEPAQIENVDGFALGIEIVSSHGTATWIAAYEQVADVLPLHSSPDDASADGLFSPGFQYLKADRMVPAVIYPKSHEAVTVHRSLGPNGEHSANYLRVHGEEQIACSEATHPGGASPRLLEQVNAWIDSLSPGTSVDAVDVEGTDFVRLQFRRSGPDVKTDPQRATNVGFGLTYALPVVIGCLMASSESLLLVENPEAHLHPAGQALLGRLCAYAASGGAQVIVETHSDHVLNAIRLTIKEGKLDADRTVLHFFTRESGVLQPRLSKVQIGSDGMIDSWPAGFFDQWDQAVEQLLD